MKRAILLLLLTTLCAGGSVQSWHSAVVAKKKAGGAAPPSGEVFDQFTGTNGNLLNGRTPSPTTAGGNWTLFEGTAANQTIQGNKASFALSAAPESLVVETGASDGEITTVINFDAGGSIVFLLWRVTDTSNYYQLACGGAGLILYKIEGGSATVLDTDATSLDTGLDHTVTITFSGSAVSASTETLSVSGSDSFNSTATKVGMRPYNPSTGTATVDDFHFIPE